jgi:hypothetical protein
MVVSLEEVPAEALMEGALVEVHPEEADPREAGKNKAL